MDLIRRKTAALEMNTGASDRMATLEDMQTNEEWEERPLELLTNRANYFQM